MGKVLSHLPPEGIPVHSGNSNPDDDDDDNEVEKENEEEQDEQTAKSQTLSFNVAHEKTLQESQI